MVDRPSPRDVAQRLSRYLCGTGAGIRALAVQKRKTISQVEGIASAHGRLELIPDPLTVELGQRIWEPEQEPALARALREELDHPATAELILYGSQARGSRTGFSDVDAILVIRDEAAEDPDALRSLRPRVLAALRAVLRYQPMQHHGFEVVTPRLLLQAGEALALPPVALSETSSVNGARVTARFAAWSRHAPSFDPLCGSLRHLTSWPAHPWDAHRYVAMFELLPTLYLQRRAVACPKWRSFQVAHAEFGNDWWPYETLAEVRRVWPRMRRPILERSAAIVRNPWPVVAAWRRMPGSLPKPVRPLLTPHLLEGLQALVTSMLERSR
jgi:putative nucleotidyltransferase DUF294